MADSIIDYQKRIRIIVNQAAIQFVSGLRPQITELDSKGHPPEPKTIQLRTSLLPSHLEQINVLIEINWIVLAQMINARETELVNLIKTELDKTDMAKKYNFQITIRSNSRTVIPRAVTIS